MPLLIGVGGANDGHILQQASPLAERGKLAPLLAEQIFEPEEIAYAFDLVVKGSRGKVVMELQPTR